MGNHTSQAVEDTAVTEKRKRGWSRISSKIMLAMAVGVLAVSASKCPSLPEKCSELSAIDVGGYSLRYRDMGSGAGPVVILIAGEGDNTTVWRFVQPAIAEFTRVIAYDRGGVWCSDRWTPEKPRTAAVIADELEAFLDALGLDAPVIICAHSIGGIYTRYFTHFHPERVAGMVLVDATHESIENQLAEVMTPESQAIEDLEYGIYFDAEGTPGILGEYYNRYNSYDQVRANRSLPVIPFTYLSAGNYDPGELPQEQVSVTDGIKEAADLDQASLIPGSQLIEVPDTGHVIQIHQPQAVIDAVQSVFNQVSGGK